ncbi:MAG TPA: rod shape-determining protein, partial [Thermotogota bacterium]|nr:rod shape-determining protein [Thermotogota bacterium]
YFQHLLEESLIRFSGMITEVFKRLSPDLSAEFLEKGLRLTGGPINENWFIRAIEEKTGFSAVISDTPGEDILRGFKLISSDLQRDQLEKFNLLNNGNEVRG